MQGETWMTSRATHQLNSLRTAAKTRFAIIGSPVVDGIEQGDDVPLGDFLNSAGPSSRHDVAADVYQLGRIVRGGPQAENSRRLPPSGLLVALHGVALDELPRDVFEQVALAADLFGGLALGFALGGLLFGCGIPALGGRAKRLGTDVAGGL